MPSKIINNKNNFEEGIFKISTLYIIVFTLISLIVDYSIVGYGVLQQFYSVNMLLFISIYLLSRKLNYTKLIIPLLIVGLSTIIAVWFLNGGVGGIAPYLLMSFSFIVLIICNQNQRSVYYLILIIVFFLLTIIEARYPELVINPTPLELRALELSISMFIVLNVTFLLLNKFLSKHDDSKQELSERSEEINIKNSQLEEINSELNSKITELKNLNDIQKQLNTIIVHDIKGPVSSIINGLEILKPEFSDSGTSKSDIDFYKSIIDSSKQVNLVVDNILLMAQIDRGSLLLKNELIQIKYFVDEVTKLVEVSAKLKDINIVNKIGEGLVTNFDKNIFSIIIRNIIYNAIKYSKKNSEIIINCKELDEVYEIEVQDFGLGMDISLIEKIYKGINTSKSSNSEYNDMSTGFGFKIIQSLIKSTKQSFNIESEENKGTKVNFTIPKFKTND